MARCWGVRGIFEEASLKKDTRGVFCVCMCRIIGDGERERERRLAGKRGWRLVTTEDK
jgi:hypothetical protein